MSTVEEETIPILKAMIMQPRTMRRLNLHNQMVLANWAVLRAMVFDRLRDPDSSYFSINERHGFAKAHKKKPIETTHVWLTILPDGGLRGFQSGVHSRGSFDTEWRYLLFNCVLGQIAIQVFHWSGFSGTWIGDKDLRPAINLRKLDDPVWKDAIIRVWPRRRVSLEWPPRKRLTFAGIRPFYNRFHIPS